jgi:hypothetical protein
MTIPKKTYRFTPEQIRDELTDRIEQGWTNDQIVDRYEDTGPNLRRWLTNRRRKLQKFWDGA